MFPDLFQLIRRRFFLSFTYYLEKHENRNDIHEGRIELKVDLGRTDVVAAGEDSLHEQGSSHGVENPVLLGYAELFAVHGGILVSFYQVSTKRKEKKK